jgi:hypothetical protein
VGLDRWRPPIVTGLQVTTGSTKGTAMRIAPFLPKRHEPWTVRRVISAARHRPLLIRSMVVFLLAGALAQQELERLLGC